MNLRITPRNGSTYDYWARMRPTAHSPFALAAFAAFYQVSAYASQTAPAATFDADLMRARGLDPALAAYFSQAARFMPGSQRVSLYVNGERRGSAAATFDDQGNLCFDRALLEHAGLVVPDALKRGNDEAQGGKEAKAACYDYRDAFVQATVDLDPGANAVRLIVPAEAVKSDARPVGKFAAGACTVAITGGGDVHYSEISSSVMSKTGNSVLGTQSKSLSVTCGSLINAYVSLSDNKADSVVKDASMLTTLGASAAQLYGLGTSGTGDKAVNIGAYTIAMGPGTTTNLAGTSTTQAAVLSSMDKSTWTISTSSVLTTPGGETYYSTGASAAGSKPVVAKTFAFPLTVKAALNNSTNMPVTENVVMDGWATFTVAYN